ncbi:hypothetical protein TAMA11512_02620 [Selenomonas sp. TAMA-11512]|uniref:DUF2939 domain-containing protein n=1 Tax=Selenomonas sp. TAMA-11512 TaxID=3095337 RepID=UPI003089B22C|nr:hypothetical protein TAMA11512_02620 [Selenomonas sp. TAMA-11512]
MQDEDFLRERLEARRIRAGRRGLTTICILLVALALGTALWYFFLHIRSPQYALEAIQDAIEDRDSETFAKYVDLVSVGGGLYDDLTADAFSGDKSLSPRTREMFTNYYLLIRPQVIEGLTAAAKRYAKTGAWENPGGIVLGRQLGFDFDLLLDKSLLATTTPLSIDSIDRDGTTGTASVLVREETTGITYTLIVGLEQAAEGHWQVISIRNYRSYLDAARPVYRRDTKAYLASTQALVNQYNTKLAALHDRFAAITTGGGTLSPAQREELTRLIRLRIIPLLKERQQQLSLVDVPAGAALVRKLRVTSTEKSVAAWEAFMEGLQSDDPAAFDRAETLHKQALDAELRIEEVKKSAT